MGGKAILILVLGFSMIFWISQRNFSNMGTETTKNISNYYYFTKCRAAASVGVNILCNRLFFRASAVDTVFSMTYDGVTLTDSLTTIDAYQNIRQIVSVATVSLPHSVGDPQELWLFSTKTKVIVKPSLFSKYAYFSHDETPGGSTIYWTTKDTIWGPFHTNDNLNISGNPVWYGDVSIGGNENKQSGSVPKYYGSFTKNVNIAIPTTGVSAVSSNSAGGASFTGKPLIYMEFRGDSIRFRYNTTGAWTYRLLSTFTPNGVIYAQNAEVHISGVVKGKYSLSVDGTTGNLGNVYLDDNVTYNTDPKTNPSSTDMLGIVAKRDVIVTENTANATSIKVQAAIYCETGSFRAQNYDTRVPSGFIDLYGGITQYVRGAVSTFSGSTITHGFSKRYRYDERLLISYPPYYPGCGSYEVASWFE